MSTFDGDFTRRQELHIHQQLEPTDKSQTGYRPHRKPNPYFQQMTDEEREYWIELNQTHHEDYDTDGHGNVISDADPGL